MFRKSILLLLCVSIGALLAIPSFADEIKDKDAQPAKTTPTSEEIRKSAEEYLESLGTSNSPAAPATGEQIKWQVISSGGGTGISTSYGLVSVVGQVAVGSGISASYGISHGFLQDFGEGSGGCCIGITGNVDNDGSQLVDIGDLTALIGYMFIPPFTPPVCMDEANVDGAGTVDIGDVTALIGYLFIPPFPLPTSCP